VKVAVAAIARSTFDLTMAEEMASSAFGLLTELGVDLIGSPDLLLDGEAAEAAAAEWAEADLDALVLVQASFADSSVATALATTTDAPLVLWAFPEERTGGRLRINSLCGINLAGFALAQQARSYRWIYRHPQDPLARAELQDVLDNRQIASVSVAAIASDTSARAKAADVRQRLTGARVGIIGDHPDGFEPCAYDADELEATTGVVAVAVPLPRLFDRASAAPAEAVGAVRDHLDRSLTGLDDVDQVSLDQSLRLHVGLRGIVDDERLSAIATRCWPECFTDFGAAACSPQSLLSDAGVPACCEADAFGTVTSLALQWLTESPVFVADLVDLDFETDTGVFWHCGLAPLSLADPEAVPAAALHSNRVKPLLNEFPLKPGRVTLARFSQSSGSMRLVIGGGEMLRAPLAFGGTAGVLQFDRPAVDVLSTVMSEGLEHHYGIGYGDVRAELYALADQLDLDVVAL